ncbi:molybdopterin guanine dinucleotide-containing S/N-oxide reductase [Chelatococcus asaccharovorans]|uniref:Biotin/methionine sulfoxide reductase n=1 Tax=Chelatococcus asaccharovorans TaxID=28210 RepID=A0A2V3UIQ3_9HYPH|nr:molybdopterin guanine dinucleotide-containing S/N-oxide reductase [Chelatococcus asaccharovorans]MBS7706314.1 molybdopterin guanine dinucleotide-containing S/N-oxide reductase [Chelatococcus asaccharovorans]PXW65046.1 biotin/methionine sulfoxide reductase [Chelatococcus asaccharovorans]
MAHYTLSHWGLYEVEPRTGRDPAIAPFRRDPDPNPIGLYQLDPALKRLRVRRPAIRESWLRDGPGASPERRGQDAFVEVPWDEALDLVAGEIARVRKHFGNSAIFGGSYGWSSAGRFHHAQSQVHRFLNAAGGYVRHVDSYSLGAANVVLPHIVASMDELMASHTSWEVMARHTELFVTFGGVPVKNAQMNAGGVGLHGVALGLASMRQAGVPFVNIGPVRDNLGKAGVDAEWIACRPNTDTAVMLALGFVLCSENRVDRDFLDRCCVGYDTFAAYLTGAADGIAKTPEWAETISGVPAATIAALARRMAASRTMLNVSWSMQRASHGEQPFWAVIALAAMLGQIGQPGGGFGVGYGAANLVGSAHARVKGPTLSQGRPGIPDFIPVARIADMLLGPGEPFTYNGQTFAYPDIRLIYWAGGNPFHHHQDLNRLRRAWQKPETIVVNEQYWTATAKRADIILPATTTLERDDIGSATLEAFLVAMKRVVPPAHEARDDYDIFAALADRLGCAETFTENLDTMGWLRRLYDEGLAVNHERGFALPDFDSFWREGLVDLTAHDRPATMLADFVADPARRPLRTPSGRIEIFSEKIAGFGLSDCPGHAVWREPSEWLGADKAKCFPLHLLTDQPARRLHSQLDASPHSRAGKVAEREPVYLNPADAAARGIADGQIVEVFNDRGRCLAGAIISDDIMPGVARLSTGAWYDPDPATDLDRHGNPNVLTRDAPASSLSQGCSAQSCLVEIAPWTGDVPPVTAFDLPEFTTR